MSNQETDNLPKGERKLLSTVISAILLAGVGISSLVLAFGLALLLIRGRTGYHEALSPALIMARVGTVPFPTSISGVLQGVAALKPFAVIELGALILIATPVLRVGASVVLFFVEHDRLYAFVTLAVFIILLISIFLVGSIPT